MLTHSSIYTERVSTLEIYLAHVLDTLKYVLSEITEIIPPYTTELKKGVDQQERFVVKIMLCNYIFITKNWFSHVATPPSGPGPLCYRGFTITLPLYSVGLLWSGDKTVAETTHNTHWREISKPLAGFEPAIQVRDRPQSHTLDGAATVISFISKVYSFYLTDVSIVSTGWATEDS
jgi:hypothetical protein